VVVVSAELVGEVGKGDLSGGAQQIHYSDKVRGAPPRLRKAPLNSMFPCPTRAEV